MYTPSKHNILMDVNIFKLHFFLFKIQFYKKFKIKYEKIKMVATSIKRITQKSVSCVGVSVNFLRLLNEQYNLLYSSNILRFIFKLTFKNETNRIL